MTGVGQAPSAGQWVERAEHDLRNAEHTLTLVDDCPLDTVCFHAQQCAEKYLKALLVFRRIAYPLIHDLTELLALLPEADRLAFGELEVEALNPYVIEGRYPGDWDPIDRVEAETAVAIARSVRQAVRALLPADVLQS